MDCDGAHEMLGGLLTEVQGGSIVHGGSEGLKEYMNLVYNKNKEKLIRDIAEDVFKTMKLKGAGNAQTAPLKDVVEHLKRVTPDPRKGSGGFNQKTASSSKSQQNILKTLAEAINNRYKSNMINMDADHNVMANQVSEVIHTLLNSLQIEFLTVATDVSKIVKNLNDLKELVERSYHKQMEIIKTSGDENLALQSKAVSDVYNVVSNEIDRQMALLTNALSVSIGGPSNESLITLIQDNKDFSGMIQELKGDLGQTEFSIKLGKLLSGVSSVATTAELVNKALKVLNMSVNEYKNVNDMTELKSKVFEIISKHKPKTSKELDKMLTAAELLYKNSANHEEIAEYLAKHSGKSSSKRHGDKSHHDKTHEKCRECGKPGGKCDCHWTSSDSSSDSDVNGGDDSDSDVDGGCDDGCYSGGWDFTNEISEIESAINKAKELTNSSKLNSLGIKSNDSKFSVSEKFKSYLGGDEISNQISVIEDNLKKIYEQVKNNKVTKLKWDQNKREIDNLTNKITELQNKIQNLQSINDSFSEKNKNNSSIRENMTKINNSIGTRDTNIKEGFLSNNLNKAREYLKNIYEQLIEFKETTGGAEDDDENLPRYWRKKSLSKKVEKKQKLRKLMFDDFRKVLEEKYRHIVSAASVISENIGKSIPVNADLDRFIKFFEHIPTMNVENIQYAISGYSKDLTSRSKKYDFFNQFNVLVTAMEPLEKGAKGEVFRELSAHIKDLLKTIDNFSDTFLKTLSEVNIEKPEDIKREIQKTVLGSAEMNKMNSKRPFVQLDKIKNELRYYYKVAHIKENLQTSVKDLANYGEGYDDMLGEEAGWMINHVNEYFDNLSSAYKDRLKDSSDKNKLQNVLSVLKQMRNAKVGLIKVAQAVDLYLKAFTDGIANDPDSISNILHMLEQVEIVAKWFNEKSGDNLATLYECFGGDAKVDNGKVTYLGADETYFNKVVSSNKPLGNPETSYNLNTETKNVDALLKLSEKTVKSMRALENILSIFHSVGNRFGNVDVSSKTFMNEGQIFNALCEYIKMSSFTIGDNNMKPKRVVSEEIKQTERKIEEFRNVLSNISSDNTNDLKRFIIKMIGEVNYSKLEPYQYSIKGVNDKYFWEEMNDEDKSEYKRILHNEMVKYLKILINNARDLFLEKINSEEETIYSALNENQKIKAMEIINNKKKQLKYDFVTEEYLNTKIVNYNTARSIFPSWEKGNVYNYADEVADYNIGLIGSWNYLSQYLTNFNCVINTVHGPSPIYNELGNEVIENKNTSFLPFDDNVPFISVQVFAFTVHPANIVARLSSNKIGGSEKTYQYYFNSNLYTDAYQKLNIDEKAWVDLLKQKIENLSISSGIEELITKNINSYDSKNNNSYVENLKIAINSKIKTNIETIENINDYASIFLSEALPGIVNQNEEEDEEEEEEESKKNKDIEKEKSKKNKDIEEEEEEPKKNKDIEEEESKKNKEKVNNSTEDKYYYRIQSLNTNLYLSSIPSGNHNKFAYADPSKLSYDLDKDELYCNLDLLNKIDNFSDTDLLFEMVVKSIVAKVMTTIDSYRLFHRPIDDKYDKKNNNSFAPLRSILGGKEPERETPRVLDDEDAMNLYVRLPLLAEWYRGMFGFEDSNEQRDSVNPNSQTDEFVLSVLPNMDGVWSDFNHFIYNKMYIVGDNSYNESQARELISIINNIVKVYKSKVSGCNWRNIIDSYVLDINRSYGFIKQKEVDAYLDDKYKRNEQSYDDMDDDVGAYDILDSKSQFAPINAPSDKYTTQSLDLKQKSKKLTMYVLKKKLIDFRNKMDSSFYKEQNNDAKKVSLTYTIQNYLQELKATDSEKDKYELVLRMMQVSSKHLVHSSDKLIMLHETVAAPLALLTSIYSMLIQFSAFVNSNAFAATGTDNTDRKTSLVKKIRESGGKRTQRADISTEVQNLLNPVTSISEKDIVTALLNKLCKITSLPKSLITMNPVGNNVNLNFKQVEEMCMLLLNLVKSNLNKMRVLFTKKEIFEKFESKDKTGSVNWLEENLVEQLFKDSNGMGLNQLNSKIKTILDANGSDDISNSFSDYIKNSVTEFNENLSKYLDLNRDPSSNKFYIPLIENFANGVASKEFLFSKKYPDDNEFYKNKLLLTSKNVIGNDDDYGLQKYLNKYDDRTKKRKYAYDSLAEIPEYMKDRMRTNLPYFIKMFTISNNLYDNYKRLIKSCNLTINPDVKLDLENNITRMMDLTNELRKSSENVLREIADINPLYMDVRQDFIQEYKSRNGKLPLMPLSSILTTLLIHKDDTLLQPSNIGSNSFKFNRGVRLILGRDDIEPNMDHIPGAKDIYNSYSNTVRRNNILSMDEYTTMCKLMIKLVRYFGVGNSYENFNTLENKKSTDVIERIIDVQTVFAFQTGNNLSSILSLTENSNLDDNRNKIAKVIDKKQESDGLNRPALRIYNIIDMDIVPINVHAMMREIPFTNLLNYSYTFDRMVHNVLSPSFDKQNYNMIENNTKVNTVNYLLLKILIHPYSKLIHPENTNLTNKPEFTILFTSLCAGNDGLRLGRPRYLSDQILRKVLLMGYSYQNPSKNILEKTLSETSPLSSAAISSYQDLSFKTNMPSFESYKKISSTDNIKTRYIMINKPEMIDVSFKRFDTKLVRNLVWLVNLQRIIRVMLITHLDFISTPVINNIQIANPNVTEYQGVEEYENDDYNGKRYGPFGDYDD
jgi:hypothetical protein